MAEAMMGFLFAEQMFYKVRYHLVENVFETLKERGFIQQCTNADEIARLLSEEMVTYYVGFDATADSFHVGSLVPIMAMVHLQRAGHTPIAIIGGGTTMIGDPSGKTTMRQMISRETIESNGVEILSQLKRYLNFSDEGGVFLNNADWLIPLNFIEFLRDIGRHFRVNEMIRAEAYRQRLEREEGLSFIEFNYQLLQAYDFLHLFRRYGCAPSDYLGAWRSGGFQSRVPPGGKRRARLPPSRSDRGWSRRSGRDATPLRGCLPRAGRGSCRYRSRIRRDDQVRGQLLPCYQAQLRELHRQPLRGGRRRRRPGVGWDGP